MSTGREALATTWTFIRDSALREHSELTDQSPMYSDPTGDDDTIGLDIDVRGVVSYRG